VHVVVAFYVGGTIAVNQTFGPYPNREEAVAAGKARFGDLPNDEYGRYYDEDSGDPVFGVVPLLPPDTPADPLEEDEDTE
jgi:hypothetical protein